jgi:Phage tail protein
VPYPSPITYPSELLFPGSSSDGVFDGALVAIGDLLLNTVDSDGVFWILENFSGWGSPGSTAALTQRARGHGSTSSEGFFKSRVMTLEGTIDAPTAELLSLAVDKLSAAVTLDGFTLLVAEAGRIRHCSAQRQDDVIVSWIDGRTARFSIQIAAKDPRKFGDLVTATTRLPFSEGGLEFPVTFPVTFTGVSGTGILRVNNPGNTQAPVWLRIDGPIPAGGWTVTHVGKKQSLTFATSLALGVGEFVTVDMDRREVLAQGQSARAGYVTSRGWFTLDPGDNDIAFSAANYSSTASLTVTTKPSWS